MIAETYHLPALAKCEGARLITACDALAERGEFIGRKFRFENWTNDYHDVLNHPEIEAVFILTKSSTHRLLAEAAAKAGKHIFMQKSITDNLADAEKLLETVKACGVQFTVSFMHRYFDECVKGAELLRQNVLGELQQVRIQNCTKNPYETAPSYGGCILDIGSHGIDLVNALFGSRIQAVLALEFDRQSAAIGSGTDTESELAGTERFATLLYELEDKKRVLHEINWSSPSHISRFQVDIVVAFAVNQRDEVCDLHDLACALGAQPGMKQQTFVAACLNPWDTQRTRVFMPEGTAPTLAGLTR